MAQFISHAPAELTHTPLRRIGEGIGKVVYASPNWVVKRERSPTEIVALIVLWRILRRLRRFLPSGLNRRLTEKPSRQIRFLRLCVQASMAVFPKALWFTRNIQQVWLGYVRRNWRGERLARTMLTGTKMAPEQISFPTTRVAVRGWPGYLSVNEATERVEMTLDQKLVLLGRAGQFEEIEVWLNRLLDVRQSAWRMGLFSTDAHLKNFGVIGERIVLLDAGGLTDRWSEIEPSLVIAEKAEKPHVRLGLGAVLEARPEIAERFNARWKATVNRATVRELWPD